MSVPDTYRGAKIGTRIAHLVSQAIIYTHSKLLDVKHRLAVMVFNTISNEISDEVDTTLGPLLKGMAAAYEDGGQLQGMMHFMAHGRGQFKAIVGSSTTAQSLLWALGTVISNELAPIAYGNIETNPHLIPDPATLAGFAATGRMSEDDALKHIRQNGYFDPWGKAWIDASKNFPSITDLNEWRLKGLLSADDYMFVAKKLGYDALYSEHFWAAATSQLSFQDKGLAYLRGMVSKDEVYSAAKEQGILPHDVDVYLDTIGEPPGTMDMLEAYRRGFIDRVTLERGILQSRVRNEWIPMIEQLRYSPMSTADAVNAAVQGHIPQEQMARLAEENGLEPGHVDVLYQTAGSPLSRTELNDLYNRGEIGSDVVKQGLRESRLKDKYVDDAFALRRRILEPRTVSEAVHNGVLDHDTALKKVMESGFNAADAAVIVSAASAAKMRSYKERLLTEIENVYVDGGLEREQVLANAKQLGYTDDEAEMLTRAADFHKDQRVFNAAVTAIRSKYIGHHLNHAETNAKLTEIGMPSTQRDHMLKMWDVEAAANVKKLTEAQVVRAIKTQTITPEDGAARLQDMGYSEGDTAIILAMI
jgi:hypothetical protein